MGWVLELVLGAPAGSLAGGGEAHSCPAWEGFTAGGAGGKGHEQAPLAGSQPTQRTQQVSARDSGFGSRRTPC